MNITEQINTLIAQHGSERDALNITLSKLQRLEQALKNIYALCEGTPETTETNNDEANRLDVVINEIDAIAEYALKN